MTLNGDLIGTVLAERWEVVEHLGNGAMGTVYRARHVQLKIDVAIKVLKRTANLTASDIARFYRESQLIASLNHDHIVRVQDTGKTASDDLFFVMEYLRGPNLRTLLRREGPLSWPRTRTILLQVCDALGALHSSGMIHRDLKPHNIVLDPRRNQPDFVKLLDFGVAKPLGEDRQHLTQTGFVVGTLPYMAPEYLKGHPANVQVDIYALGVIAFELVTGVLPEANPGAVMAALRARGLPAAAQKIIARAMASDLRQRYAVADTLADALAAIPEEPCATLEETTTTRFPGSAKPAAHVSSAATVGPPPGGPDALTLATTQPGPPPPSTPTVRRQIAPDPLARFSPGSREQDLALTRASPALPGPRPEELPPTVPTLAREPESVDPPAGDAAVRTEAPTRVQPAPVDHAPSRPPLAPKPTPPDSTHSPSSAAGLGSQEYEDDADTTGERTVVAPQHPSIRSPEALAPDPEAARATGDSHESDLSAPALTLQSASDPNASGSTARLSSSRVRAPLYAAVALCAGALVYNIVGSSPPAVPPQTADSELVQPVEEPSVEVANTAPIEAPLPETPKTEPDANEPPPPPVEDPLLPGESPPPLADGVLTPVPIPTPPPPIRPDPKVETGGTRTRKTNPGRDAYKKRQKDLEKIVLDCGQQYGASRGEYLNIHVTFNGTAATIGAIVLGPHLLKGEPAWKCAEQAIPKLKGESFAGENYKIEREFKLAK